MLNCTYRRIIGLSIILLAGLNYGCTTTSISDVSGGDTVLFTAFEATFPPQQDQQQNSENNLLVKASIIQATDGGFTQNLYGSEIIKLDGVSFFGPQQLTGTFDIAMTSIAFGVEQQLDTTTKLGLFGGVASVDVDLTLSSQVGTNVETSRKFSSPYIDIYWLKNHSKKFFSKFGFNAAITLSENSNSLTSLHAGIGYKFFKNAEVMAGFRNFVLDNKGEQGDSGILLDPNGPYFSVNLVF